MKARECELKEAKSSETVMPYYSSIAKVTFDDLKCMSNETLEKLRRGIANDHYKYGMTLGEIQEIVSDYESLKLGYQLYFLNVEVSKEQLADPDLSLIKIEDICKIYSEDNNLIYSRDGSPAFRKALKETSLAGKVQAGLPGQVNSVFNFYQSKICDKIETTPSQELPQNKMS